MYLFTCYRKNKLRLSTITKIQTIFFFSPVPSSPSHFSPLALWHSHCWLRSGLWPWRRRATSLPSAGRGRVSRLCSMPFPNPASAEPLLGHCLHPATSPSSLRQGLEFTHLYFHEFTEHLFTVITFKTLFVSCISGNAIFFFSLTKRFFYRNITLKVIRSIKCIDSKVAAHLPSTKENQAPKIPVH